MSASREKKNRQNPEFQTIQDVKAAKAAQEKAQQRRSNILYLVIAIVFVLIAAGSLLAKSGILQRNAAAMELDGRKYTVAEVDYYYANAVGSVRNSNYASYFGLDTSVPYDQQELNDTARMLLGVADDSIVTWEDYFRYKVKQNMTGIYALERAADEAGFAFDAEQQAELDSTMESLNTYAANNGYSSRSYLKMVYGSYMTMDTFKSLLRSDIRAEHYSNYYADSLTYSDADLQAYYEGDKEHIDVAEYEYLNISGAVEPATDANGNPVDATEEQIAAAAEAAKACLADVEERVAAGESMEKIAKEYDNSTLITYNHVTGGSYYGTEVTKWVFDESRVAGDITTLDTTVDGGTPTYYVILFHSAGRPDYKLVNVRHILLQPDSANTDTAAAKADAKAQAEDLLKQWKDGAATEDSFAELATQYTTDPGSQSTGGLYESVDKGEMVAAFNDWCFDASRKVGDTGIVETDYGYHVMYFSGFGETAWKNTVRNEMKSADFENYSDSIKAGLEATELSGMKYVG